METQGVKTQKKGYPKGFWACGCTEIFERLAYYLGRSLILIFVTTAVVNGGLGLADTDGAKLQSSLTAFAYLGPIIGGFICDRFVGARYTTPFGMVLAAIGYYLGSVANSYAGVYAMIMFVSCGLALFRTAPIIGRVITDKDQMDSAFSIRYSLVNVGAFIGTLLVGVLYKDVFAKDGVLGFAPCFKIAAVVMVLGAIWFIAGWKYLGDVGKKPFNKTKTAEELERAKKEKEASKGKKSPLTTIEKKRIGAIILVSTFSIIFWIFWYLAYLPVYYHWTSDTMNWVVLGYEIPVTWFDAFNAFFCVVSGPITAKLWAHLESRPQGDMSLFRKLGIGIGILGIGYIFFAAMDIFRGDGRISVLWLLLFLVMLTLGEMFFSPLGQSFISKYSPSRYLGVMMGIWGVATFFAAKGYGYVYEFVFGGRFTFASGCIGVAVVAFASTIILFVLDKKLSALVED